MAKWSSQHNGKFPDPYSKLKFDSEKKKEKKKKKAKREKENREIDSNTNKVSIYGPESGGGQQKGQKYVAHSQFFSLGSLWKDALSLDNQTRAKKNVSKII